MPLRSYPSRSPSSSSGRRFANRSVPSSPEDLEVYTFRIGADEYAVLTFRPFDGEMSIPELGDVEGLTPTEISIVSLVVRGQANVAIAEARGTSPRTIANQLTVIYRKLGVRSRRELCARIGETATWDP